MLTRRGWTLVAVTVGLWGGARLLGVREYMMVGVAGVSLLVLVGLSSGLSSTRLEARRRIRPSTVPFGETAVVELEVVNPGRLPSPLLRVRDEAPPLLAPQTSGDLAPIRPGGRRRLGYGLTGSHRGAWTLGPLRLELTDPFGLVRRERRLDVLTEAVVLPQIVTLPAGLPLGGRATGGGVGRPQPQPAGEELANVREYVRGDDLRRVHWRTTAHRGRLMIRQDEAPQQWQALVVLDTAAADHTGTGPSSTFERAVSLAASVVVDLDERGRHVRLVTTEEDLRGPAPLTHEVLRRLARTEATTGDPRRVWVALEQSFEDHEAVIAISGRTSAEALREIVRGGRRFALRVAVLVADPKGREQAEAATRALRAAGWRAVVLDRATSIPAAWRDLATQRVHAAAAR